MPTDMIALPRAVAMALLEHMRGWRTGAEAVLEDSDLDGRDRRELSAGRDAATALIRALGEALGDAHDTAPCRPEGGQE